KCFELEKNDKVQNVTESMQMPTIEYKDILIKDYSKYLHIQIIDNMNGAAHQHHINPGNIPF
ncbi:hypothetical protein scyTo_0024044, partial [Scyliorhinus torazame]|nr:hypothetical protein [Scyliorhinus torazame]